MKKKLLSLLLVMVMTMLVMSCGAKEADETEEEKEARISKWIEGYVPHEDYDTFAVINLLDELDPVLVMRDDQSNEYCNAYQYTFSFPNGTHLPSVVCSTWDKVFVKKFDQYIAVVAFGQSFDDLVDYTAWVIDTEADDPLNDSYAGGIAKLSGSGKIDVYGRPLDETGKIEKTDTGFSKDCPEFYKAIACNVLENGVEDWTCINDVVELSEDVQTAYVKYNENKTAISELVEKNAGTIDIETTVASFDVNNVYYPDVPEYELPDITGDIEVGASQEVSESAVKFVLAGVEPFFGKETNAKISSVTIQLYNNETGEAIDPIYLDFVSEYTAWKTVSLAPGTYTALCTQDYMEQTSNPADNMAVVYPIQFNDFTVEIENCPSQTITVLYGTMPWLAENMSNYNVPQMTLDEMRAAAENWDVGEVE